MSAVDFARLFLGRQDAYGGDEGRAVRCTANEWFQAVRKHYDGSGPAVGVYPMQVEYEYSQSDQPVWQCKWGCVDFDIKSEGHAKYDYETEAEADVAARNLHKVLAAFGIAAWVERTRSHGRHVWIFADSWVPAKEMREALLVCCGIAEVSIREVNPKSDGSNLTAEQLGNYVRLPYNGDVDPKPERRIIDIGATHETTYPRDTFVAYATESATTRDKLRSVAALYRPPLPDIVWQQANLDEYNGDIPKVVRHVIENGPNDGDRSKGMLYIAHECKKAGLGPKQALDLVSIADDAWGKYTGRRDREQRLIEIVERAWK